MLKAFAGREDGFALVLFSIILLPLIGFLGLCFDLGRGWLVHDKMAIAAQAAALYAVERIDEADAADGARAVFAANLPAGAHGVRYSAPTVAIDTAVATSEVHVRGGVPTLFMRYLGYGEIEVAAEARAERAGAAPRFVFRLTR